MVPFFITKTVPIALGDWGWLFGAGLFPGFFGILLAVMALDKLPAATFGTLAYFEPICVVVIGWLVFGETLNVLQLSGCGLIIISGAIRGYLSSSDQASPPESATTPSVCCT